MRVTIRGMWRYQVAGSLVGLLLRIWRRTVRLEVRGEELLAELPGAPVAVWHGRMQGVGFALSGKGVISMASASADGEVAARVFKALRVGIVRGSTGKGGVRALAQLLRAIRDGAADRVALTVDGPKGPPQVVKSGIIEVARRLDRPIIPATFSASPCWVLQSWDRMVLARPFARVLVAFGQPVELPRGVSLRKSAGAVATALRGLTDQLDTELCGRPLWNTSGEPEDHFTN